MGAFLTNFRQAFRRTDTTRTGAEPLAATDLHWHDGTAAGDEPSAAHQRVAWTTSRLQADGSWEVTETVDRLATDEEQATIDAGTAWDNAHRPDADSGESHAATNLRLPAGTAAGADADDDPAEWAGWDDPNNYPETATTVTAEAGQSPPPEWTSQYGPWTQVRVEHLDGMDAATEVIHYHPNHPDYADSDDALYAAYDRMFEQGEADYFRDLDHQDARVLDQFSNENPGADLTTLDVDSDVDDF